MTEENRPPRRKDPQRTAEERKAIDEGRNEVLLNPLRRVSRAQSPVSTGSAAGWRMGWIGRMVSTGSAAGWRMVWTGSNATPSILPNGAGNFLRPMRGAISSDPLTGSKMPHARARGARKRHAAPAVVPDRAAFTLRSSFSSGESMQLSIRSSITCAIFSSRPRGSVTA